MVKIKLGSAIAPKPSLATTSPAIMTLTQTIHRQIILKMMTANGLLHVKKSAKPAPNGNSVSHAMSSIVTRKLLVNALSVKRSSMRLLDNALNVRKFLTLPLENAKNVRKSTTRLLDCALNVLKSITRLRENALNVRRIRDMWEVYAKIVPVTVLRDNVRWIITK